MNIKKMVENLIPEDKKKTVTVTNTMVNAIQNYANKEIEIDQGFSMIKPQKYNYFSVNASLGAIGFVMTPFATPFTQQILKYENPFRNLFFDELWIQVTPDRNIFDPVVYPPRPDRLGYRLLVNNIITAPDIRTPPFPIVETDVNNAWIHPVWEWTQVLHPKHPIKLSAGDVVVQQVALIDAPNLYIWNWYLKGHSELIGS